MVETEVEMGKKYLFHRRNVNESLTNNASLLFWQCPSHTDTCIQLFEQMVGTYAFHELRTTKQLGYVCYAFSSFPEQRRGFQMVLQSNAHSCHKLTQEMLNCVEQFRTELVNMEGEEFDEYKISIINALNQPETKLKEFTDEYWPEIKRKTMRFDRKKVDAKLIAELTKENVLEFLDCFILKEAKELRLICVEITGKDHDQVSNDFFEVFPK